MAPPVFLVQGCHSTRPRAIATMGPQELLGMAPHYVLDCAQEAPRVLLDIGLSIGAFLKLDEVLDDHAMAAVAWLAHHKHRNDHRLRLLDQSRQRARSRSRLAEKRDEDRLAAFGVLIERNADQLAVAQRLEHGARGRTLAHDIDAGALTHPGHQRVAGHEALRVMHEGYLMAVHRVRRRQQLEVSEVGAEHDDAAARIGTLDLVPVMKALIGHAPDEPAMKKPGQT